MYIRMVPNYLPMSYSVWTNNLCQPCHDPTRGGAQSQVATMQRGTPAVGQAATEWGSIIGTGSAGAGYNRLNVSSVLIGLLATNRHAPLLDELDDAPPIEPILHRVMTDEELRASDPLLHELTAADRKLISVYGDTLHRNDGSHLHGGIDPAEDRKMQRLHH